MGFDGQGAAGGAASGAAAGSVAGPWGALAGGVVGGVAGGLMGGKKKQKIDIGAQLAQVQANAEKNRNLNTTMFDQNNANLNKYATDSDLAMGAARDNFNAGKNDYLAATDKNTEMAKDSLRRSLYSDTFNGMPDALRSIREASAAGGGLDTGSYQKQVNNYGVQTAQTLGQGERDIQMQGMQNNQTAQGNVFGAFNTLSNKLTDQQMSRLSNILDTGDADTVRKYATEMGLNDTETQGIVDLLNFKQSGEMAQDSAASGQKGIIDSLLQAGGNLGGQYIANQKLKSGATAKPVTPTTGGK